MAGFPGDRFNQATLALELPHPDLRLAAGIMKPSGDRARRWKKPSMTPHSVQTDPAASDLPLASHCFS